MIFVIDTNILISALIRDSTTRKIIVKSNFKFVYPEEAFHEIRKYKDLILKKSGMNEEEYEKTLFNIINYIALVPSKISSEHYGEAFKTLGKIDPDDVIFLATALSIKNSAIWSDDAHFEKQDKVKAFKTRDVLDFFNSKKYYF